MAEPFIAQIMLFGGNFPPRGSAFCDGQLLQIAQFTALFSLLGTTYGGDGRTTFALPDLRGRVAVKSGQGPGLSSYTLGQRSGRTQLTLQASEMPAHTHAVTPVCDRSARGLATPANRVYGADPTSPPGGNYSSRQNGQMAAFASQPAGSGSPVDLMQPYLAAYYCIACRVCSQAAASREMAAELTAATFSPHEGEAFAVHPGTPGQTPIELTLIEVTEHSAGMRADDDRRVPFSLRFRGPAQPLLRSGMHTIAHGQIGEHTLFMNPVQAAPRGQRQAPGISYEVVFN